MVLCYGSLCNLTFFISSIHPFSHLSQHTIFFFFSVPYTSRLFLPQDLCISSFIFLKCTSLRLSNDLYLPVIQFKRLLLQRPSLTSQLFLIASCPLFFLLNSYYYPMFSCFLVYSIFIPIRMYITQGFYLPLYPQLLPRHTWHTIGTQ